MPFTKRLISLSALVGACLSISSALSVTPTSDLWSKFEVVQQGTRALHQEFDVMRHVRSGYVDQVSRLQMNLDFAQRKWREQPVGAYGNRIRVFDGENLVTFEPGGTEYAQSKRLLTKTNHCLSPTTPKSTGPRPKRCKSCLADFQGRITPVSFLKHQSNRRCVQACLDRLSR